MEPLMKAKDAVKIALTSTQNLLPMYLSDLSDADLLVRPVPNANHIAWQLGHLINSEKYLVTEEIPSAVFPELPAKLVEKDKKETSRDDTGFCTKAEYLDLFGKVRNA